jgi:hypothetical protein
MPETKTTTRTIPNPVQLILHVFKTIALAGSLLGDRRINPVRKGAFVIIISLLIAAALGVEGIGEILTEFLNVVPGLGVLLGIGEIPVDATVDWILVAVVAFNLLKLFPADIVGEHYDRLFRRK